ncbi:MAG: carboxypeptidase-like regulatory domain-containing protein [Bacteroidales bacterium]|nr:carboxypeptidase-like regulatory domain-containing protein [Bacteroidales bacterium]
MKAKGSFILITESRTCRANCSARITDSNQILLRIPDKIQYKRGFRFSLLSGTILMMLISLNLSAQDSTQTIKGRVVDNDLQIPLPGATVVILDSDPLIGITTDMDGYFRLENVRLGRYGLQISYMGYEPSFISELEVGSGKEFVAK